MSAQLICKVIRILETLISIILMNLDGGAVRLFSVSVKKREKKPRGFVNSWEIFRGWGGSLTFGVTAFIQS